MCGKVFENLEEISGNYVCKECRIKFEIDYKLWQLQCIAKELSKLYDELNEIRKGGEDNG